MQPMMKIVIEPVQPAPPGAPHVNRAKLTLVSPPWPTVGDVVRWAGARWLVTKTSATRGMTIPIHASAADTAKAGENRRQEGGPNA